MTTARYEQLMEEIDSNRKAAQATIMGGDMRNNAEYKRLQQAGEHRLALWQQFLLPDGERPPQQIDMDGVPMDTNAAEQYRRMMTEYQLQLQQETRPGEITRITEALHQVESALLGWDAYNERFREQIHTNEMAFTAWPVYDDVYLGGLSRFQMPEWNQWRGEESA